MRDIKSHADYIIRSGYTVTKHYEDMSVSIQSASGEDIGRFYDTQEAADAVAEHKWIAKPFNMVEWLEFNGVAA